MRRRVVKLEKFTFDSFMDNPIGVKGIHPQNKMVELAKLTSYLKEINNGVIFSAFKLDTTIYLKFKIPTDYIEDEHRKFYYDVVMEFIRPLRFNPILNDNLKRYHVRFFSNMPSFAFNYGYVLNDNDLIIDILKPKLGEGILNHEPEVKNKEGTFGYEKSTYTMGLYINDNSLNSIRKLSLLQKVDTVEALLLNFEDIIPFTTVMDILSNPKNKEISRNNSEKMKDKREAKSIRDRKTSTKSSNTTKSTKPNSSNKVGRVNRVSSNTNKTKKVKRK